jgi:hypothetical protein
MHKLASTAATFPLCTVPCRDERPASSSLICSFRVYVFVRQGDLHSTTQQDTAMLEALQILKLTHKQDLLNFTEEN